ncbi:hypothetical protein H1R20_g13371, partial [Candolleomyces eurysporus]
MNTDWLRTLWGLSNNVPIHTATPIQEITVNPIDPSPSADSSNASTPAPTKEHASVNVKGPESLLLNLKRPEEANFPENGEVSPAVFYAYTIPTFPTVLTVYKLCAHFQDLHWAVYQGTIYAPNSVVGLTPLIKRSSCITGSYCRAMQWPSTKVVLWAIAACSII